MDNILRVRVSMELKQFYNGNPDMIKEALTLYKRSKENFIKHYEKESNE